MSDAEKHTTLGDAADVLSRLEDEIEYCVRKADTANEINVKSDWKRRAALLRKAVGLIRATRLP